MRSRFFFIFALPASLVAQAPSPPESRAALHHGRTGTLNVAIPKIAHDVRVDGNLGTAEWTTAALLTGFSQYTPVDGSPADDSTEVLVMYGDHAIYIAIRAFEPHGRVLATLANRDRIDGEDHIRVYLESFKYPAFLFEDFYVERRAPNGAVIDTVKFVGTNRLPNLGVDFNLSTPQWQRFSGAFGLTGGHDDNFDRCSSAS